MFGRSAAWETGLGRAHGIAWCCLLFLSYRCFQADNGTIMVPSFTGDQQLVVTSTGLNNQTGIIGQEAQDRIKEVRGLPWSWPVACSLSCTVKQCCACGHSKLSRCSCKATWHYCITIASRVNCLDVGAALCNLLITRLPMLSRLMLLLQHIHICSVPMQLLGQLLQQPPALLTLQPVSKGPPALFEECCDECKDSNPLYSRHHSNWQVTDLLDGMCS